MFTIYHLGKRKLNIDRIRFKYVPLGTKHKCNVGTVERVNGYISWPIDNNNLKPTSPYNVSIYVR